MAKSKLIPSTTEYAIRAMAQLVLLSGRESVRAEEIAKLTNIPKDYLSKVLRQLVRAGLLVGEKGHGGGFSLAYLPREITFQDIFEAMGFEFSSGHCAFGWDECSSKTPCPLHESYKKLEASFHAWASSTTLNDIENSTTMLRRLERFVGRRSRS